MRPGFFPDDNVDCRWTNPEDVSDHERETNSDYSDEMNCDPASCKGFFCVECGVCIHESFRCNAVEDCFRICDKLAKDQASYDSKFVEDMTSIASETSSSVSSDEANCTFCRQGMPYPDPALAIGFPFSDHEVFGAYHVETLQRCISIGKRCDGCRDFENGEDEDDCHYGFPLVDLGFEKCPMERRARSSETNKGCSRFASPIFVVLLSFIFVKFTLRL